MLVLTIKRGRAVRIAQDIWVTVERIEGGQVGLGFVAPKDIPVVREELLPPDERRCNGDGDPRLGGGDDGRGRAMG